MCGSWSLPLSRSHLLWSSHPSTFWIWPCLATKIRRDWVSSGCYIHRTMWFKPNYKIKMLLYHSCIYGTSRNLFLVNLHEYINIYMFPGYSKYPVACAATFWRKGSFVQNLFRVHRFCLWNLACHKSNLLFVKVNKLKFIYIYLVCVCVCLCVWAGVYRAHVWRSEDNMQESFLTFYHVNLRDQTQVIRLVESFFTLLTEPPC